MKYVVWGIVAYVAYQVLYCRSNPGGPFCLFPGQIGSGQPGGNQGF